MRGLFFGIFFSGVSLSWNRFLFFVDNSILLIENWIVSYFLKWKTWLKWMRFACDLSLVAVIMRLLPRSVLLSFCLTAVSTWLLFRKIKVLIFLVVVYFDVYSSNQATFLANSLRQLQVEIPAEPILQSSRWEPRIRGSQVISNKTLKQILIYTTFFSEEWQVGREKEWSKYCPSCIVTRNKQDIATANAVLFLSGSVRDLPPGKELALIKRPPSQKWIFLTMVCCILVFSDFFFIDFVQRWWLAFSDVWMWLYIQV